MRRESDHQRGQPRALEAARVCGHSDGAVQAWRGGGGGGGGRAKKAQDIHSSRRAKSAVAAAAMGEAMCTGNHHYLST